MVKQDYKKCGIEILHNYIKYRMLSKEKKMADIQSLQILNIKARNDVKGKIFTKQS